jgi:protocatechuate 3,4-dioxygenase beta subunit
MTEPQSRKDKQRPQTYFTRRSALLAIGGAASAGALLSCGSGSDDTTASSTSSTSTTSTSSTSTTSTATTTSTSSSTCAVTPEGEIGPYFVDDSATGFNRSDIRSNLDGTGTQTGIPLTLTITVQDSENSCTGLQGAQVDIWHCNADGVYSAEDVEDTSGLTWLRGYQVTDSEGQVTFTTIFPGWYAGRTTHIHLRVRSKYSEASSTSDGTNTTQLFFPQTTIDTINTSVAPYSSHGTNSTTNATDRVYTDQTDGKMELTLSGDGTSGYVTSVTIDLPITAST